MNNRILIIFNPVAGRKYRGNYKKYFLGLYNKSLPQVPYDWLITTPHIDQQLSQVDLKQYSRLIIIGGDGTVKEVAEHLLKNNLEIPLGIVPQGSANVLASCLNIPFLQASAIKNACLGKEKKMDVCLLNNKYYFLICLSIGHWSKIVKETKRGLKIHLGFLAYLWTFLWQWKIYRALFKFKLDNKYHEVMGNTMVIANALSILKLRPRSPVDLFDGNLEVLIGKNATLPGFIGLVLSFFLGKRRFPFLFKAKGKKIIVDYLSEKEKLVQVDGETIEVNKIEVEILPHKLTVIC